MRVELPLIPPLAHAMKRVVNHRASQSAGQCPVIGEAAALGAAVVVGAIEIVWDQAVRPYPLGSVAPFGHHRLQEVPVPVSQLPLSLYRFEEIQQIGDRHLLAAVPRVDDRKVSALDPSRQGGVADAKKPSREPARNRFAQLFLERRAHRLDVAVLGQVVTLRPSQSNEALEQLCAAIDDTHGIERSESFQKSMFLATFVPARLSGGGSLRQRAHALKVAKKLVFWQLSRVWVCSHRVHFASWAVFALGSPYM